MHPSWALGGLPAGLPACFSAIRVCACWRSPGLPLPEPASFLAFQRPPRASRNLQHHNEAGRALLVAIGASRRKPVLSNRPWAQRRASPSPRLTWALTWLGLARPVPAASARAGERRPQRAQAARVFLARQHGGSSYQPHTEIRRKTGVRGLRGTTLARDRPRVVAGGCSPAAPRQPGWPGPLRLPRWAGSEKGPRVGSDTR